MDKKLSPVDMGRRRRRAQDAGMRSGLFVCCLAAACVLGTRLGTSTKPFAGSVRAGAARAAFGTAGRSARRGDDAQFRFPPTMETSS